MIFSWRFTVAPLCAVYHGGDGSKAGNSARTLPRRPLAKVAQEQDAAVAARGSDEAGSFGRGDLRRRRRRIQGAAARVAVYADRARRQPTGEPVK